MARTKGKPVQWVYVYYKEHAGSPAYDWLMGLPKNIRVELANTIDAV